MVSLMPNGITRHAIGRHAELRDELSFHRARVHEDVVAEPVLNAKRQAVEPPIAAVARRDVDVVRRQDDALANQPVVGHQEGAVEELELVVPQDVEDWGPRASHVRKQPGVVPENAAGLLCEMATSSR